MTNSNRQTTAATIGNGTAVHAVDFDGDYQGILTIRVGEKQFAAGTVCGQTAGRKGFRRIPNQEAERAVTCKKCLAALAKRSA